MGTLTVFVMSLDFMSHCISWYVLSIMGVVMRLSGNVWRIVQVFFSSFE